MDYLSNKFFEVHDVLTQYIDIHNNIFKSSIRKIIPIPGIFKKIDYEKHYKNLSLLADRLKSIINGIEEKNEASTLLKEYSLSLYETISILRDICEKLLQKSQGQELSYTREQYNLDVDKYNSAMHKYQTSGNELNKYRTAFTKEIEEPTNSVKVHVLDPIKGYYIDAWIINEDIAKDDVDNFVTPEGELFVIIAYENGEPQTLIAKKEAWEKQRDILGMIDNGQDYKEALDDHLNNLKRKIEDSD